MVRRLRLLVFLLFCAMAGCAGSNKPPSPEDGDAEQGRRLMELFDSHAAFPVSTQGEIPLTFQPIEIDKHERDGKGYFQALLPWAPAAPNKPLADYLTERIQRNTHELNTAYGRVSAFWLHVAYDNGDPDEVEVRLSDLGASVALPKFCARGRPSTVTVRLQAATWHEEEIVSPCVPQRGSEGTLGGGKLLLVVPGDLPIRFDECELDSAGPRAAWHVADAASFARQALAITEPNNPRLVGREAKSFRMLLAYRDVYGRYLRDDDIVLELSGRQGVVPLPGVHRGEGLGGVTARAVSVTWKERNTTVPLTK
jgi:hypothetical protein